MRRSIILGSTMIAMTLPIHFFVPHELSVQIAAITLAIIAGAYIGFAAHDGRLSVLVTELVGSALFGLAALIGLTVSALAIPLEIMAHAGWDLLHHNNFMGAPVPQWYIPFCMIVDVFFGGVLLWLYLGM